MVQMCCNPQARKKILNCCWQYNVIIELATARSASLQGKILMIWDFYLNSGPNSES